MCSKLLIALLGLAPLCFGQIHERLTPQMIGKYQLETSEGFDAYMSELGVNWFTRKVRCTNETEDWTTKFLKPMQIACALYPTATNIQNPDGSITINTSSTFKSTSVTFRPGVKFQVLKGVEKKTNLAVSIRSEFREKQSFKN